MAFESFPNTQYLIPDTALSTTQLSMTTPDLEDMPNNRLPFGIDLSRYNTSADGKQKVDFDIINAFIPLVEFIAMRAGISWGYQDPWFNYYFQEGMRIKKILMPYHVVYPGQPAQSQMDNFFRIVGDVDFSTTPLVLDLELDHGQSKSRITKTTIDCLSIILRRTGRIPVIYSRANWVNQFLHVPDLPPVHWWLAQYRFSLPHPLYTPEYPSPPTLPHGVTDWKFHQTTQRGRSIGAPGLYYMDHNRFNGTFKELKAWAGLAVEEVICPLDDQPCSGDKYTELTVTRRAQLSHGRAGSSFFPIVVSGSKDKNGKGKEKDPFFSLFTGRCSDAIPSGSRPQAEPEGASSPIRRMPTACAVGPLPNWIIHKQKQSRIRK